MSADKTVEYKNISFDFEYNDDLADAIDCSENECESGLHSPSFCCFVSDSFFYYSVFFTCLLIGQMMTWNQFVMNSFESVAIEVVSALLLTMVNVVVSFIMIFTECLYPHVL